MKRPKIAKAQGRDVAEWVGKDANEIPPRHVQLRVFRRHGGRCHIAQRKIMAGESWQCDHVVPVEDGGPNRESNLAPALTFAHAEKTGAENSARAKADRVAKKHLGLWPEPKRKLEGRGFSPGRNRAFEEGR